MQNDSQHKVSAAIPSELRTALERSAREHDRSVSGELREALRSYLDVEGSGVSPPAGAGVPTTRREER